ncbi:MAG: hypothetical protein NZZ41_03740 [Candidatus Dojkabacteria bacterium]|nr:hypothetical protein [Candidatus Dojkabacteria bacterium]
MQIKTKSKQFSKIVFLVCVFIILSILIPVLLHVYTLSTAENTNNNTNQSVSKNNYKITIRTYNWNNNSIENAEIYINNQYVGKTNKDGEIVITTNTHKFSIHAILQGYEITKLDNVILNEKNRYISLPMIAKGKYGLQGKFLLHNQDSRYSFVDDKLLINGENVKIENNGTFRALNLNSRTVELSFESANFKDFKKVLSLNNGYNEIGEFNLIPAGDIKAKFTNYINDLPVNNVKVQAEGVSSSLIKIIDNNMLIKDLDINKTIKIRISADKYDTREYSISINQGENTIKDLKMVPSGMLAFYGKNPNNPNYIGLYIITYDGKILQTIFEQNTKTKSIVKFKLIPEKNLLYFVSNHEISPNSKFFNIYEHDITNNQTKKINTTDINSLDINFISNKMIQYSRNNKHRTVYLASLSGDIIQHITSLSDSSEYKSGIIPDIGNTLFYVEKSNNTDKLFLYDVNAQESILLDTAKSINLLATNKNGNKLIYERKKGNIPEILLYTSENSKFKVIRQNILGQNYEFNQENDNEIIFIARRADQTKIVRINLNDNTEKVLLNYTLSQPITYFYQQNQYIVYGNENNQYIFEYFMPVLYKVVVKN